MNSEPKRNILMATMGMEIGGAETHIVELSKALAALGHEVTVCSNGGVYVPQLEEAGIRHVSAPLHKRSLMTMLRSYFSLRRLISREKFDIVHAHARIPSFLCGMICKNGRKIPFCTTAHFTFQTGGMAGKLTNWGTHSLAVSEDIRTYLLENYDLQKEQISITINGIDPVRFSPEVSGDRVREELNIPQNAPLFLHVSRLDDSPGMVAERLIAVAPELVKAIPDVHLLIVGGGTQLERFQRLAEETNASIGRNVLTLTGGRTDIANCIAACDMFIGVSRAALEALCMEKPVVLSGHQGHGGIFSEEKLGISQQTNFCYRGLSLPTTEILKADILALFTMDDAAKKALGAYGREVVLEHYSTQKMAEDALEMYQKVIPPKKVLLSGYYGFHNAGDEAILKVFLQSAKTLAAPPEITVLSSNPADTSARYGTRAIHRFRPLKLLFAIKGTDVLVSGGGSLLQDKSSTRSIVYYLTIIRLAKRFGKPVMIYANGIGPVSRERNRRRVKKVVSQADIISLREEHSKRELEEIGVTGKNITVSADPIFLLKTTDEAGAEAALRAAGVPEETPCIGISLRSLRTNAQFPEQMAKLADRFTEELGLTVVFLPMHLPYDSEISREVMQKMKHTSYLLDDKFSPETLIAITAKMEMVLAMRLHTMLFAAKAEIPVIGLICDPKIAYFCEKLHQPSAGAVEDFDVEALFTQTKALLTDKATYTENIKKAVREMEEKALDNTRLLEELLQAK